MQTRLILCSAVPLGEIMQTGVKVVDSLFTIGKGQRMGIFAGSGVGKSVLMGEFAKAAEADINVIALIGERGREIGEFVRSILGPEGFSPICGNCFNLRSSSGRTPNCRLYRPRRCRVFPRSGQKCTLDDG